MAHRPRESERRWIATLALAAAARASSARAEGIFTEECYAVEGTPTSMVVVDLDGDARPDAAVCAASEVVILKNWTGTPTAKPF